MFLIIRKVRNTTLKIFKNGKIMNTILFGIVFGLAMIYIIFTAIKFEEKDKNNKKRKEKKNKEIK